MRSFTLILQDATRTERIEDVTSFVGEDKSGAFSLWAGHERMMTSLLFSLARYRAAEDTPWQYLAVPGALVYFNDNTLTVSTRRYLRDADYERITRLLNAQLLKEEDDLRGMKTSLQRMEDEMMKRLWQMGRGNRGAL
ncbi:MAG: F0F1 ATP synthase subunit epsilon [Alphaproteobacteria bacterium]|nr:F0F1 ATP synthase subunit epsilon [Alphaproteobacteria bacterium]